MKYTNNTVIQIDKNWKKRNEIYLNSIQKFLDKVANIQNEELREEVIIQMLKCDEELTKMAEKKFQEYYEQGRRC